LNPSLADQAQKMLMDEVVQRVLGIVEADSTLSSVKDQCDSLWKLALEAVGFRELLSGAFTDDQRLLVPSVPPTGQASFIVEPNELGKVNDQTVELVKNLAKLLDKVLALRNCIDGNPACDGP